MQSCGEATVWSGSPLYDCLTVGHGAMRGQREAYVRPAPSLCVCCVRMGFSTMPLYSIGVLYHLE